MRRVAIAAGALAIALAGCGGGTPSSSDQGSSDNQAGLACDHFRNIAGDVSAGTLTAGELRGKLKEVSSNAIIAPADVQEAATAMLRAATQGDDADLGAAVTDMDSACKAAGH